MQISKIDLHLLPKIGQKSEYYIPDKLFNQQLEGVLESKNIPLPIHNQRLLVIKWLWIANAGDT